VAEIIDFSFKFKYLDVDLRHLAHSRKTAKRRSTSFGAESVKDWGFLRKIQKMHFSPDNELNRKTKGNNRKCSSIAFQWMVMWFQYVTTILKYFGQFLCPALGDKSPSVLKELILILNKTQCYTNTSHIKGGELSHVITKVIRTKRVKLLAQRVDEIGR
jgi:hypothetical protein